MCVSSGRRALPRCTCCNIFQGSKKCMTRPWPATSTCWNIFLITLRRKKWVMLQCTCIQVVRNLELPAVCYFPCPQYSFLFLIMQEMCEKAVEKNPWGMKYVPDRRKTQEVFNKAVAHNSYLLGHLPDHFKSQEMCEKAVGIDPSLLGNTPDWFMIQSERLKIWYDDYHDDDELGKWLDVYQKRKVQKSQIKKELMLIAWHPSRWWDWCLDEDEKKETENCRHKYGLFCVWWPGTKIFLTKKIYKLGYLLSCHLPLMQWNCALWPSMKSLGQVPGRCV